MSKNESIDKRGIRQSAWVGLLLVFVAAMTLEATSLIQYYFSKSALEQEATKHAETQLEATRNKIMDVIDQTESAVRNSLWIAQWCLDYPDSLTRVCYRIVDYNPVIVGSTVALVPGYDRRKPLYAPYVCRDANNLAIKTLATEDYDYPSQEWFIKPIELDSGYWSEPYVDEGGGEILMTTYSIPIKDKNDKTAGVLTGDISLEWLSDLTGHIRIYPHALSLMISRTGRWMMSQDKEVALQQSVRDIVDQIRENQDYMELEAAMYAGKSGRTVLHFQDIKRYVFYAPVERTGWSMCIVIPEDDIFGGIRKNDRMVKLLQLVGLLMLILIMRSLAKSQFKYQALNERREKMENELHIASEIQMAMIPKTFPPFPDRHDLDIAGDLVPAKEVGGDLYDFFLRDDKLFFCIGDVSGKGIPASLVMAVTRSMFRTISARENSPAAIASSLNNSLSDTNETDMFVTFFCGILDLSTGLLRFCNAGHNPPMTLTDAIRELQVEPNLPLGIMSGFEFKEQQMQLHYDDAIFLYTDGVSEAENILHEQFGMDRIVAALHGRKDAAGHLKNMQKKVAEFVGDAPQSDDLTMLFLHFLGGTKVSSHQITLDNEVGQLSRLAGFINEVALDAKMDDSLAASLNLALEEAVTNVVLYAYPEGTRGSVEITSSLEEGTLTFTISDSGKPFDPTVAPDPDINASVEDRPIGGLGIFLVRNIMDSVHYEYKDGKNILSMTKKL